MRKGESSRIEALEALIAEKRKLEGYLAKLEERREGTPAHVYARLRDEYLTKLTDAQVRAHAEAETISDGLDEDSSAITELEDRLTALQEERVEGDLRAAVGELDAKEWAKKLTALNASIALAEKERDARAAVVERTRAMLAEAKGSVPPAAPRSPGSAGAKEVQRPAMTGAPSFDELAFLNSVVGRTTGSTPAVPSPTQGAPSVPAPQSGRVSGSGTSGEERAPAAKRSTPAATVPPVATAAAEVPPKAAEPRVSSPTPAAPPKVVPATAAAQPVAAQEAPPQASAAEPSAAEPDAFGRPSPRSSQAVKTLKCQECGTFNFPTEWYCERCGGELAAL